MTICATMACATAWCGYNNAKEATMVVMIVNGMSIRPADDGCVRVHYYDDSTNEQVSVELTVSRENV